MTRFRGLAMTSRSKPAAVALANVHKLVLSGLALKIVFNYREGGPRRPPDRRNPSLATAGDGNERGLHVRQQAHPRR
jgi:hypothetical protein